MRLLLVFSAFFCFIIYQIIKTARRLLYQSKQLRSVPGPPKENFIFGHISDILIPPEGSKWQRHRKLITPTFHFSILNTFAETLADNSAALVRRLRGIPEGTSVDAFKLFGPIALDNICETSMGVKTDVSKISKLEYIHANEDATHTLMERVFKPWLWDNTSFNMLPMGRKLKEDLRIIFQFNDDIINGRKRALALERRDNPKMDKEKTAGYKDKKAFLDILLDASESDSNPFDDQDLKDEMATFLFEGHDTVTSAMSFTLYLLGHHREIQEKCFDELEQIFKGSDRKPTMEDLQKMKYLEQVIKEGLRLFPSVPLLSRRVTQDIPMGNNYVVPAGAELILHVHLLHRDPAYFPNPEKFDPDRFSPENCATRHPFAFVPFAAGSRNCIGQKFAMMEEKIVFSYILRNFIVESVGDLNDLKVVFGLIIRSKKTLYVQFKPRTSFPT